MYIDNVIVFCFCQCQSFLFLFNGFAFFILIGKKKRPCNLYKLLNDEIAIKMVANHTNKASR